MITRQITADIRLTPQELAYEFAGMDAKQQAEFFNELAMAVNDWPRDFAFQLQAVVDTNLLTAAGRYRMHQIGQYAEGGGR